MTPEQIIQMARDAGIDEWWDGGGDWRETFDDVLERFASAIRASTKDEDAKICSSIAEQTVMSDNYQAKECESAIRASK